MIGTKRPNEAIALSRGRIGLVIDSPKHGQHMAVIDAADYPRVGKIRWSIFARSFTNYARGWSLDAAGAKVQHYLHRFILAGIPEVDHVDRDGLNNTRANLRSVERRENILNRHTYKNNTSGYRGVTRGSGASWQAFIGHDGKAKYLGSFNSAEAAARAYDAAALAEHAEFAQLNFPI